MLPKISRYLLIIVTILLLAYALPSAYHVLFDTRVNTPYITYSIPHKTYFTMQSIDGKPAFVNRNGEVFSQQSFMDATPVSNYHYQLSKGTLPDSLLGVPLIPKQLQYESLFQYVRPDQLRGPEYGLYPLFESQPEFGLQYPHDVFRFNSRIEFIDAKTNRINESKSALYTEVLHKAGFVFPARLVSGIPSIMKRRDQGWFLVDQKGAAYHLKMLKGEPYLKAIPNANGIKIKYIVCNDFESDEFYALIIAEDNALYTLNKADYSFTKFPVPNYQPERQVLVLSGNLFNKTITLNDEQGAKVYTFDRDYRLIDQYEYAIPQKSEMLSGRIYSALFPFHFQVKSTYTDFIEMGIVKTPLYYWVILNGILLILTIVLIKRADRTLSRSIPDLILVALTGIFGFLAVWMFPNKEY